MRTSILFVIAILFSLTTYSQSTFSEIYSIMQANCATSGCHDGSNPALFNVDTPANILYAQLVDIDPINPSALSKGHKRVDPGYPDRSFLLRKIAHGLSQDLELTQDEGDPMPKDLPKLADADIELIRQWIMFGAPETGKVVDRQLINDYYAGDGVAKVTPISAPDPSEGIQIHEGPYFLGTNDEHEFFRKVHLGLPEEVEVYKIEIGMHDFSHHFILYEYKPNGHQNVAVGSRMVTSLLDQFDINVNANTIATWQYDRDVELPEGTAYFWDENTVLDMNFHVPNYSDTTVLAAEVYLNLYYRPRQQATVEMHASLASYGGANPFNLNVMNDGQDTTFKMNHTASGTFYYWVIQSHTHKLGVDYNIWLRNQNGTKGDLIYEGYYNQDYTFNQGFFDWEHPAVRVFEPLMEVDMTKGMIHEATYNNSGPAPVGFGLTSKDEMFITYYQYTTELPATTAIEEHLSSATDIKIYPNPFHSNFQLEYNLVEANQVKGEIYSLMGERVAVLFEKNCNAGNHKERVNTSSFNLEQGVYMVRISFGNESITRKLIQTN